LLINHFLQRFARVSGRASPRIAPEVMERLSDYHWPGNIREMENLVKYLLTVARGDTIHLADLPTLFDRAMSEVPGELPDRPTARLPGETDQGNTPLLSEYSWEDLERNYILSLMEQVKWNIAAAARQAKVKRSTFTARMRRLGIRKS